MIQQRTRETYYSTLARRHFLTKRAAFSAEARAMMSAKHPPEPYEPDTGAGWHWQEDEKLCRVYSRLLRRISRKGRDALSKEPGE